MPVPLDQLIAAFARAVMDAQHQLQRSHLGDLSQFFKNGAPISVDLTLPRPSPDTADKKSIEVKVPLAILVNHGGMSIRETQVTVQVEMHPIGETAAGKKIGETAAEKKAIWGRTSKSEQPYQWKPSEKAPAISVSTVTGGKVGEASVAQLTMRVAKDDVPEGLARLLDHLNKTL